MLVYIFTRVPLCLVCAYMYSCGGRLGGVVSGRGRLSGASPPHYDELISPSLPCSSKHMLCAQRACDLGTFGPRGFSTWGPLVPR